MTLNIVFGWDSVDRDLCLQGADIVLWQQYINPLRTHEPFHCPLLVKGQPESYRAALPARQPQGSSTGKTLAIMGDWTWTFPNHYISVLPVDQFKQEHLLTLCDGSSSEFIPSCFFNIFFFFFLSNSGFVFAISLHLFQINGSFTQIETCCSLAGASQLHFSAQAQW